jgi:prepilin-type N-terminal cleavage/methylation domain-containing protein
MFKKMKIDLVTVTFDLHRLLLALTIWSCHAWVASTYRLCHVLAAAVFGLRGSHKDRRRTARVISQAKACGYAPIVESLTLLYNDPRVVIPEKAGIQLGNTGSMGQGETPNSLPVRQAGELCTPNSKGFTLIELIMVIIIIGILAATVIPKINFGTTSTTVSSWGAAYMIASDIRYTQECAMASMVSKSISFTNGQSVYTFPATTPSTSSLDPTGRLPSGVTIGATITFTFNSLGEPEESASNSVTVTAGGITRTITVTQYTGMVSIS